MKILHIDSSITGEHSVSRTLSAAAVERLKATNPGATVTRHDLVADTLPQLSPMVQFAKLKSQFDQGLLAGEMAQMVEGAVKAGASVNAATKAEHEKTEAALAAFLAADVIVIGVPMYNFGIPSQLKAWIDCLAAPGRTFRYTATGAQGLCSDKKVILTTSRGGLYAEPSPMAAFDHQETYLKHFLGFIGITDISVVRAEGIAMGPDARTGAIEAALADAAVL